MGKREENEKWGGGGNFLIKKKTLILKKKVLCGNDSVEGIVWDNSVTRLLIRGKQEKQDITDMCQHSLKFGRGVHDFYGTTKGDNRVS